MFDFELEQLKNQLIERAADYFTRHAIDDNHFESLVNDINHSQNDADLHALAQNLEACLA